MSSTEPIIKVKNLSKTFRTAKKKTGFMSTVRNLFSTEYEEFKAVDKVSFEIAPGELVGYIGPNGAGKSTTIKMLTGILHPTEGEIIVDGLVPQKERIHNARKISVVFGQRSQLLWDLPALDSFEMMRKMYAIPKKRFEENLEEYTTLLGLDEFKNRPVRQLSLGQRMRCELAVALLHDPKVVYLDEPTIGLDVVAKEKIREFILQLCKNRGTTVILTTHDIVDIERLCQRMIIIDKGHVIYNGTLSEIKQRYCHLRRVLFSLDEDSQYRDIIESLGKIDTSVQINLREDRSIAISFNPQNISASDITRYIVNSYPVKDLTVEEADLEEIIREIYIKE
ncbi:ABC transporter ATP-binding protein [Pseudobacteroides cellulosolvens]|uniref:Sulfate-transporting ATPase n=1 Tax=Pseudobacteroides cellulosolvens ATCC 35603 = DSM 2933 TaxID=398512 RepID=A0A0L6JRC8_9FIRM|nr:ATP-binding cassette domain-containing protein [Pseudobacteroides cellulosolvens]KNY28334.1 Sulfate-transporting ATPase [Pseudobacteroides cellulosolvens ATCC 35603 = DSM 2933]